jgi:hypothetical protein
MTSGPFNPSPDAAASKANTKPLTNSLVSQDRSTATTSRCPSSKTNELPVYLGVHFQPSVCSVICGRGRDSSNHVGNRRLRILAGMFMNEYSAAAKAQNKPKRSAIVSEIVAIIRTVGGHFCRYDKADSNETINNGIHPAGWSEVGDHHAREKVSALLRDLLHTQYRSSAKSKVARRSRKNAKGAAKGTVAVVAGVAGSAPTTAKLLGSVTPLLGPGKEGVARMPETTEQNNNTMEEDHSGSAGSASADGDQDDESKDGYYDGNGNEDDDDDDDDDGDKKPPATTPTRRLISASDGVYGVSKVEHIHHGHHRGTTNNTKERPDGVASGDTANQHAAAGLNATATERNTMLDFMFSHHIQGQGHTQEFDNQIDFGVQQRNKLTSQLTNIVEYLDSLLEQKKMVCHLAEKRLKVEDGQKRLHAFWSRPHSSTWKQEYELSEKVADDHQRCSSNGKETLTKCKALDSTIDHYVQQRHKLTLKLTNLENHLCSLFQQKSRNVGLAGQRAN